MIRNPVNEQEYHFVLPSCICLRKYGLMVSNFTNYIRPCICRKKVDLLPFNCYICVVNENNIKEQILFVMLHKDLLVNVFNVFHNVSLKRYVCSFPCVSYCCMRSMKIMAK